MSGGPGKALAKRAGLAGVLQQRRLLVAVLVDTIGTGAFVPLTFLYLSTTSHVPLDRLGLIITAASLVALPAAPLAGFAVDRFGALPVIVTQNLISGLGFALYFGVKASSLLVVGVAAVALSERMYWAAWPVFIAERVEGGSLDRWYAVVNGAKSASLAGGAAIASVAMGLGGGAGLRAMLEFNIATSLVAAAMFLSMGRPASAATAATRSTKTTAATDTTKSGATLHSGTGVWRRLLRDRPYLVLTLANTLLAYAWLVPSLVLPIYITRCTRLAAWTAAFALTLKTLLSATLQAAVAMRLERLRRTSTVLVGAALFLAAVPMLAFVSALNSPMLAMAVLLCGVVLLAFGEMTASPATTSLGVAAAPPAAQGRYVSIFQLSWGISAVTGPALVGSLFSVSLTALWMALGGSVVVAALLFLALGPHLRHADRKLVAA